VRLPSIFEKSLRDQRWQILGFGLAMAVIAALDVFIWPAYRDMLQNLELPPAIEAFLGSELSIATPAGFLSAEFFSWTPILLLVYAVIQGTGAIAGEEGGGTMDLLLAQPVRRSDLVAQKVGAFLAGVVLTVALGWLGFLVSLPFVDMGDLTLADTAVAMANMLPITLLFYGLSLWLGAALGSRALAAGGAIALITAAYFVNTLVNAVEALERLKYATPFYYYGAGLPLVRGIEWAHAGLLLGIAAVCIAVTFRAFQRRDIATGAGELDVLTTLRRLAGAG
jgi:ABC-2 type transport system permease protein